MQRGFIAVINLTVCAAAVETSDGHSCHGSGKQALPLPSGFLLGPVRSTGLGSSPASCVHVISAADGQRINLTLYDFGAYATPVVNIVTSRRPYDVFIGYPCDSEYCSKSLSLFTNA